MDFSKLRMKDLKEFLELHKEPVPDFDPANDFNELVNIHSILSEHCEQLYNRLIATDNPNIQITKPVYDLIKATSLLGTEQRYKERDINGISQENLQLLCDALGIDVNKKRLKELLLMAGLIIPHDPNGEGVPVLFQLTGNCEYSLIDEEIHVDSEEFIHARMYLDGHEMMKFVYDKLLTGDDYDILSEELNNENCTDLNTKELFENLEERFIDGQTLYFDRRDDPYDRLPIGRWAFLGNFFYKGLVWNDLQATNGAYVLEIEE